MSLKQQLTDDMKAAMKGGDKHSLGVIRLINAAIKQREVDERIELDDVAVIAVLFAILAVLLALYMLKSALGIDVFKNFHVGIWTWFVNLHDHMTK